jgi:hypothetical protein
MPSTLNPVEVWAWAASPAVDGGGKRDGLTEFAAVDLAALETFDEVGDESFHGVVPPWPA